MDVTDIYKKINAEILNCNFYQGLMYLVKGFGLQNKKQMYENAKKSTGVFEQLLATNLVDNKGKLIAIVPPFTSDNPNDKEKNVIYKTHQRINLVAHLLSYIVKELNNNFTYTEDNLYFLVDNNIFIPEERKNAFLKGLVAGFNNDYITAMHILMTQVENSIRQICDECGVVVYKTYPNGIQEVLSLNTLLSQNEVIEIFDENTLFYYKLFFCSEYGYGMRNKIAHGIIDDIDVSQSFDSLVVWWFILKTCCDYKLPVILEMVENEKKNNI